MKVEDLSRKELERIVNDLLCCLQADRLRDWIYGWDGATPRDPVQLSKELRRHAGEPHRPTWLSLEPLGYGPEE